MKLSEILNNIKSNTVNFNNDIEITGLQNNSSKIQTGNIFIAIKGINFNGADFIDNAISNGAVAIIIGNDNKDNIDPSKYQNIPFIFVENIRETEAKVSNIFYPNKPDFILAVTGTNGKSSIVNFVRQMWDFVGINGASIGTVGVQTSNNIGQKTLTTPDAIDLHKNLQNLYNEGITNVALETSSHGIIQNRVDYIKIKSAGFTNISNDHLDYHKTIDEYFNAKLRLFSELLESDGTAVINIDDSRASKIIDVCKSRGIKTITYGKNAGADIQLLEYKIENYSQKVKLSIFGKIYDLTLNLVTEFQVYNFMCALGLFMTSVDDWEKVLPHLSNLKNEKGRIEYVGTSPNGAKIYVDFGHNGDGLKKLLTEFRPYVDHNLICIAGCSGDRPDIRRIEMGKVLNEYADTVIIVDDNPRTEDPKHIRDTIVKYCPKATVIPNRYKAIDEVIDTSRHWDSIIICGTMYEKDKEFIRNKLAPHSVPLDELLLKSGFNLKDIPSTPIYRVSSDSNTIIEGSIFIGINGFTVNGADYTESAIKNGAKAVIVEKDYNFNDATQKLINDKNIVVIKVDNTRKTFADIIYNFYNKTQPDTIVAITGSSGKSSVVDFTRQLWALLGLPAISSGTIGIIAENVYSKKQVIKYSGSDYTTPVNGEVYKFLKYFKEKGVNNAAIELSSHGLDQLRMENIKIASAGFTNLGTDHVDFYGDAKSYLYSKSKLFRENLSSDGTAVLNADISEYEFLKDICDKRGIKVFSYGKNGKELKILSQKISLTGQDVEVELFGHKYHFDLKILGSFQLYNLLCALGMVIATTPSWQNVLPRLGEVKNAVGRLEYMGDTKKGASIYVDFAYKGDALVNTLKTLRSMTDKKIICVFSTCGDVYETRRRQELGEAAQQLADIAILTDDSPRFEDAQKIRNEVMAHCPKAIEIKTGRKDAIKKAIELASKGDVILIAGKGHEDYIVIKDNHIPYTDQQTVLDLLKEEE